MVGVWVGGWVLLAGFLCSFVAVRVVFCWGCLLLAGAGGFPDLAPKIGRLFFGDARLSLLFPICSWSQMLAATGRDPTRASVRLYPLT